MLTKKTERQQFQGRFGESGHFYFTKTQVDNRFALCKDSLIYETGITIKLKGIYESLSNAENFAVLLPDKNSLHRQFLYLDNLGYGGKFHRYEKYYCPEGVLFPFVRVRGRKKIEIIDTGCIWMGTRFDLPLIYVDNDVANWISCYSLTGRVRREPFLPYHKIIDALPRLANKERYPDLEIDLMI